MALYCYKAVLVLQPRFASLVVQLEAAATVASVTWVLQKTGGAQMCWRSLLVALRPLWNFCTIFLSRSKLSDSLSAAGGLGACVFTCFGPRRWSPISVQGNVAPERLSLGLFWKEPSGVLARGEAAGARVTTSCPMGGGTVWKPVPRARKGAKQIYLIPQIAFSAAPTGIYHPFLGASWHLRKMHLTTCPVPAGMSRDDSLFQEYAVNCWAKIERVSKA